MYQQGGVYVPPGGGGGGGTVLGSGTLNYVAKWTPNGSTIGDSDIYNALGLVGIGTASPGVKLDVVDNNNTAAYASVLKLRNIGNGSNFTETGILFHSSTDVFTADFVAGRIYTKYNTSLSGDVRMTFQSVNPSDVLIDTMSLYNGRVGIGITEPLTAKLQIISTAEQFRSGYDASNYWNATTSNAGLTTFDAVGASAGFSFSDRVGINQTTASNKALSVTSFSGEAYGVGIIATNLGSNGVGLSVTSTSTTDTRNSAIEGISSCAYIGNGNTEAVGVDGSAITQGYTNIGAQGKALNGVASNHGVKGLITSGGVAPIYSSNSVYGENLASVGPQNNCFNGYNASSAGDAFGYNMYIAATGAGTSAGVKIVNVSSKTANYGIIVDAGVNNGFGTLTPLAQVHIIKTTEQLRIGYDASNYYKTTVTSTGIVQFDATGASAGFQFLDQVYNLGGGGVAGNAAFGISALIANVSGANNAAFGERALVVNSTGSGNVAVGYDTLSSNTTGNYCVAIGNAALAANNGNNNIGIGGFALQVNSTGTDNIVIGYTAGQSILQNYNIAIGTNALKAGGGNGGCVAIGYNSLTVCTGYFNTAIGFGSGASNTTGLFNTYLGLSSGSSNVTGSSSVFVGYQAGYYETASNKLFIDNTQRNNEAGGRIKALIYGVFDADPVNQELHINAAHINIDDVPVGRTTVSVGELYVDTAANVLANSDLVVARKV